MFSTARHYHSNSIDIGAMSRAPDKVHIFISKMPISSPNSMFDHLLELSYSDNSNKWSNIGCGKEIMQVVLNEISGSA